MSQIKNDSGITKTFGNVYVHSLEGGTAPEKNSIAVLKQDLETVYPAAQGGNSRTSSIFNAAAFGKGQTFPSKRAAIIKVPLADENGEPMTKAKVEAIIAAIVTTPRLYRILSNKVEDVMTEGQLTMIANGRSNLTIADYKRTKLVRESEDGPVILDANGQKQYGATYFSDAVIEDMDLRSAPVRTQMNDEKEEAVELEPVSNFITESESPEM